MVVLVLGAAAVAFLVMQRSAGPPLLRMPAPALQGEPDIYMESPVVSQYREDGTREYRLVADNASHYEGKDLTLLTRPRLELFRHDGPPWHMRARSGVLTRPPGGAAAEKVTLQDDVVLESSENDKPVRLTTPTLTLFPERQYAETDQDVKIISSFGETTGTGLEADLKQGTLELRSTNRNRVHTLLQPQQFK